MKFKVKTRANMNMKKAPHITATGAPEQKPGILALSTMTAEDGATVGLVDIVDVIGKAADENIRFSDKIAELVNSGCKKIRVRVNSPGGCVFTALSIYDTLQAAREKGVYVQSEVMGLAASAASFVILAADKVCISANSQIMVHEPATMLWGTLSELREGVELTEKVWRRMVGIYTARTGKTPEEFEASHNHDVYYSAEQAVAAGLADEIAAPLGEQPKPEEKPAPVQPEATGSFMAGLRRMAARLGLMPAPVEPTDAVKLHAALEEKAKISAELEGMRAQLAAAVEERAAAQQERDAAMADRSADIEKAVAARLRSMGAPVELPPVSDKPAEVKAEKPALLTDEKVMQWLAGRDYGSAVSYACQSAEHRAQVNRLRASLK